MRITWLLAVALFTVASASHAQIEKWQFGGSGTAWDQRDSLHVLIDFSGAPGAIQPLYLQPDQNVIQLLDNWEFWREPSRYNLGYVDGQKPRFWNRWNGVGGDPTQSGVFLVDPDSATYNPPQSQGIRNTFFSIDTAVPIPAVRFGFFTPPRGFRSDGTSLPLDAIPAFDVSIGPDSEPAVNWGGNDLFEKVVANAGANFDPTVHVDFQRQYTRFFRWRRQESLADAEALNTCATCGGQGNQALALKGSIGGFEVFAQGIPQRVIYLSQVIDLGQVLNFGRLQWAATPMRLVDGIAIEDHDAEVWVQAEVRVGRDGDPVTYHEYTNIGREKEVPREEYQSLIALLNRDPRPGIRGSIGYDSVNWSFWSVPFTDPGELIRLRSGSHLQLNLTLESRDFDAWIRLDSLWIETAPLLADEVFAEVARLDDPQPTRGFTEVELGKETEFVYQLRAEFASAATPGFDALRIRTGSSATFRRLEMGEPPVAVEPTAVHLEEDALVVQLPEQIRRANNTPIRVVFGAQIFEFAAIFEGEIFTADSELLPQAIVAGDAGDAVSTNSLRVLSAANESPKFIQSIELSTPVLTPNGDGIHDQLEIRSSLFRLPGPVPVALEIYGLDGRRRARIENGLQDSGPRQLSWDGRDEMGQLLDPGLYLFSIVLTTQSTQARPLQVLGIAY
jgi:hypothetical protein